MSQKLRDFIKNDVTSSIFMGGGGAAKITDVIKTIKEVQMFCHNLFHPNEAS